MKKFTLYLALALLVTGCSLTPKKDTAAPAPYSWEAHQHTVNTLNSWVASGKIGIRTTAESHSASLSWKQKNEAYRIRIKGPLGQGGATVSGDQHYATLEIPGEQPLAAASPEELLQLRLGWEIPVQEARYWIKGLPSPNSDFDASFSANRLATLNQDNWEIRYLRYIESGNISLPGKIIMYREGLKLTLIINNWQKVD